MILSAVDAACMRGAHLAHWLGPGCAAQVANLSDLGIAMLCQFCIRCRVSIKAVETQTIAVFSPGLRDVLTFRTRCSSGKLSALLLG